VRDAEEARLGAAAHAAQADERRDVVAPAEPRVLDITAPNDGWFAVRLAFSV